MIKFANLASVVCLVGGAFVPLPGAFAASAWSPSGCGHEPFPPAIEGGTVQRYNSSIDRAGAYEKAARAYSSCVTREALAQQNAISSAARARMDAINAVAVSVQKRISGNFGALSAQLKSAGRTLAAKQ